MKLNYLKTFNQLNESVNTDVPEDFRKLGFNNYDTDEDVYIDSVRPTKSLTATPNEHGERDLEFYSDTTGDLAIYNIVASDVENNLKDVMEYIDGELNNDTVPNSSEIKKILKDSESLEVSFM